MLSPVPRWGRMSHQTAQEEPTRRGPVLELRALPSEQAPFDEEVSSADVVSVLRAALACGQLLHAFVLLLDKASPVCELRWASQGPLSHRYIASNIDLRHRSDRNGMVYVPGSY